MEAVLLQHFVILHLAFLKSCFYFETLANTHFYLSGAPWPPPLTQTIRQATFLRLRHHHQRNCLPSLWRAGLFQGMGCLPLPGVSANFETLIEAGVRLKRLLERKDYRAKKASSVSHHTRAEVPPIHSFIHSFPFVSVYLMHLLLQHDQQFICSSSLGKPLVSLIAHHVNPPHDVFLPPNVE